MKILSLWPFCVAGHIYVGEDYTSRSQHTKGALFQLNHGYAKRTLRNDLLNDVCLLYRSYKINYALCKNKDVIARRRVNCLDECCSLEIKNRIRDIIIVAVPLYIKYIYILLWYQCLLKIRKTATSHSSIIVCNNVKMYEI